MIGWVALFLLLVCAGLYGSWRLQSRDHHFEKSAVAVQAVATTVALLFAGYWYIYERKGEPHANTALEVVGVHVAGDFVTLQTRFSITNLGATLLRVSDFDVRLQEVNAASLPLSRIAAAGRDAFPEKVGGMKIYDNGVLMWPTVKWFRSNATRSIEPGETDLQVIDFVASCRNTAMRVLFMAGRPGSHEVWYDQALVSLSGLCSNPVGSKEVLSGKSGG